MCFDVIFQFIFGYDVFGYKGGGRWNSGPFNDEYIAGSYLQKFSFFSIFYLFEICKNIKTNKLLISLIILFHLIAILLAGNKMPLILFLFGFFLIFISFKNLRQIILISTMFFLLVFAFLFQTNDNIKNSYIGFTKNVKDKRSKAVLEIRCHETPFMLQDSQIIGKLIYETLASTPNTTYGEVIGSNYQGQTLKLSKHFKSWH